MLSSSQCYTYISKAETFGSTVVFSRSILVNQYEYYKNLKLTAEIEFTQNKTGKALYE
jgi:hypothetical protein